MTREELQAIGQQLRASRLERDHTLDEVASATRIRVKFLEAIEAGEPDDSLSDMQIRGFLRNYAAFLHLDLDAMLAAYQKALETKREKPRFGLFKGRDDEPPPEVPVIPLYGQDPVKTPPGPIPRVGQTDYAGVEIATRSRFVLFLMTLMALSLLVIALAAGVFAFSQLSDTPSDEAAAPLPINVESGDATDAMDSMDASAEEMDDDMLGMDDESMADDMAEASPTPTATRGADGIIVNTPSMTGADQIAISLEATQRSWVRLVVDGDVQYEGLLRPGTALQYQGQESITLRTSNAGGLAVVVNNQPLGSLGERGEGFEQTFTLDAPLPSDLGEPSPTPTLPVVTQAAATAAPTAIPTNDLPTLPPPPQPLVTEEGGS